jgi:ureidoacrylate peracid hydrolase
MKSSQMIKLDARPQSIDLDLSKTAVVVIDMQNDFASKGGLFDVAGVDVSPVRAVISATQRVLAAARNAGMTVVYLKMGFLPDLSDLGAEGSVNRERHLHFGVGRPCRAPDGREGRFLVRDTWNTDIVADLTPHTDDVVLYKHRFSGFFETDLHDVLRQRGIVNLIFTGCTTSVCVDSTLRDAMFRDYRCVLMADCTAEPIGNDQERSNHEASLLTIQALLGWVSTSERLAQAVEPNAAMQAAASVHQR